MKHLSITLGAVALLGVAACGPKAETAAPAEPAVVEDAAVVETTPAADAMAPAIDAGAAATDAGAAATDAAAGATDAAAAVAAEPESGIGNTGPDKGRGAGN